MKVVLGARRAGKTTAIVRRAAELDALGHVAYIVTAGRKRSRHVVETAKSLGLAVRFPISFDEYVRGEWGGFITHLLFDDLDDCLRALCRGRVLDTVTLTDTEDDWRTM